MNLAKKLIEEFMTFLALMDPGGYELRMIKLPAMNSSMNSTILMSSG